MNQSFTIKTNNEFEKAEIYYSVLSQINNLKLTKGEIKLVAYTAVKGNISNANVRVEYCKKYNTTESVIGNIISKLKKIYIFVKDDKKKTIVNSQIVLDFNKDIQIGINIIKTKK